VQPPEEQAASRPCMLSNELKCCLHVAHFFSCFVCQKRGGRRRGRDQGQPAALDAGLTCVTVSDPEGLGLDVLLLVAVVVGGGLHPRLPRHGCYGQPRQNGSRQAPGPGQQQWTGALLLLLLLLLLFFLPALAPVPALLQGDL